MKILIVLLLLSTAVCAQEKSLRPANPGVTYRDFKDSKRQNWLGTDFRPMRSTVWYPAGAGGKAEYISDPSQFTSQVKVLHDAKLSNQQKKFPLILISHGAQGNARQMRWLGYYLASRGYIAVAISHNGTDAEEKKTGIITLSDFCMWQRPQDMSAVLDKMLLDPFFASRIDTSKIAAAGFSLGGATAIWMAGPILDVKELARKEPAPPQIFLSAIANLSELVKTDPIVKESYSHSKDSFKDIRFKAVFALAPAIGQGFNESTLKTITIPIQIVVGDADIVTPQVLNASHYTDHIPSARKLIVLPGERGHYLLPAKDDSRPAELEEVSKIAFDFFEGVLK